MALRDSISNFFGSRKNLEIEVKKLRDELTVVKATPFPSLDALWGGGFAEPKLGSVIPYPMLYEASRNSNELQIIFSALKREIFRNGFEFKSKWEAKCLSCKKEFDFDADACTACGFATLKPNLDSMKSLELFFENVNVNRQSLLEVMEQCEEDLETADECYIILLKNYVYNFNGSIESSVIKEIVRGSPLKFSPLIDKNGRFGYNENGEKVYACPEHRTKLFTENIMSRCPVCDKILCRAEFKSQNADETDIFYLEGEVIYENKYHPQIDRGYSPILSVWNKVEALRAMDLYVREYYGRQRPPKGLLLVNTNNTEELNKMWEKLVRETQGNPHLIKPLGVQSNSQRGQVAQFIDFMNTLTESQYVEIRQEFRLTIGARFGVSPIFQNDVSTSGGLNNEGLQITVTNRAVEFGQNFWNSKVFPQLMEQFQITEFKLVLKPSEEQDESAEVDRDIKKAQHAQLMQQMGFSVSLDETGKEFVFSEEAVAPLNSFGSGGFGSQGFDDQRFGGEPASYSKALSPVQLQKPLQKKFRSDVEALLKKLNLKKKLSESDLQRFVEKAVSLLKKRLEFSLESNVRKIYSRAIDDVSKELGVSVSFGGIDQNAVEAIKSSNLFKGVFDNFDSTVKSNLVDTIEKAYSSKGGLGKLVDDLSEVVEAEDYQLERIARTETHHISTIARMNSYAKVDVNNDFKFRWIGPEDSRTTAICKEITDRSKGGLSRNDLYKLVHSVADKYGFKARDWTPHIQCRHVPLRTFDDINKTNKYMKTYNNNDEENGINDSLRDMRKGSLSSEKSSIHKDLFKEVRLQTPSQVMEQGFNEGNVRSGKTGGGEQDGRQELIETTRSQSQIKRVDVKSVQNRDPGSLRNNKSGSQSKLQRSDESEFQEESIQVLPKYLRNVRNNGETSSTPHSASEIQWASSERSRRSPGEKWDDSLSEMSRAETSESGKEIGKSYPYKDLLEVHGDSARSVGWRNEDSQLKSFDVLCKVFGTNAKPHVLDVGAGLGHLYEYMKSVGVWAKYKGIDIEADFVSKARAKDIDVVKADLFEWRSPADYVVCCGAFNAKESNLLKAIPKMVELANVACAFNFLYKGEYSSLNTYSIESVEKIVKGLGFEPEFVPDYVENHCACFVRKDKVYVSPGQKAPKGKDLQVGPKGGKYYEGGSSSSATPSGSKPSNESVPVSGVDRVKEYYSDSKTKEWAGQLSKWHEETPKDTPLFVFGTHFGENSKHEDMRDLLIKNGFKVVQIPEEFMRPAGSKEEQGIKNRENLNFFLGNLFDGRPVVDIHAGESMPPTVLLFDNDSMKRMDGLKAPNNYIGLEVGANSGTESNLSQVLFGVRTIMRKKTS